MKRTSFYFLFLALAATSFLSSCSFLQKGEFADRKYYNFPRSKHSVEQTASARNTPKVTAVPQEAAVAEEQKKNEPLLSASADKKEIIIAQTESNNIPKKKTAPANVVVNDQAQNDISFKKSDIRKDARKSPQPTHRGEPALMLFLAVIASVFIPPLGIYIKDHRTNKWFWITLLLCLAGGGFYFAYTGGLWAIFWIAAVVIALMNVFDIL